MKIRPLPLKNAFVIEQTRFEDNRGFFTEAWRSDLAQSAGMATVYTRTNISYNKKAATLRGLHMQQAPHGEEKLIRCIAGEIFDVLVDVRADSETYGQWEGVVLSAEAGNSVYVPKGFLHGFLTLVPEATVLYQVSGSYHPNAEKGARYDDPAFNIAWPTVSALKPELSERKTDQAGISQEITGQTVEITLSEKDARWPLWHL
ncbi:MAG: dTDP-4-dehydrorhamnose 3,5-epimerase [Cyanobacteria bacterium P01_H01_bin.74]